MRLLTEKAQFHQHEENYSNDLFFHVVTTIYTILNKEKSTLRLTKAIQNLHEQQVGAVGCQKHESTIGSKELISCQGSAERTGGGCRNSLCFGPQG